MSWTFSGFQTLKIFNSLYYLLLYLSKWDFKSSDMFQKVTLTEGFLKMCLAVTEGFLKMCLAVSALYLLPYLL